MHASSRWWWWEHVNVTEEEKERVSEWKWKRERERENEWIESLVYVRDLIYHPTVFPCCSLLLLFPFHIFKTTTKFLLFFLNGKESVRKKKKIMQKSIHKWKAKTKHRLNSGGDLSSCSLSLSSHIWSDHLFLNLCCSFPFEYNILICPPLHLLLARQFALSPSRLHLSSSFIITFCCERERESKCLLSISRWCWWITWSECVMWKIGFWIKAFSKPPRSHAIFFRCWIDVYSIGQSAGLISIIM